MAAREYNRRHSRDDVARTALQLLDERGLPDLTMRNLAVALDVQPSALYWHFPNKQTLLAELADRIVETAVAPDSAPHTVRAAFALRDALLSYRDGAEVVASTLALGLGSGNAQRQLAAAIVADECDDSIADRAAATLLHFILGHVSHEQQRMQYDSLGAVVSANALSPAGNGSEADDFRFGIDLFLHGLQSHSIRA